MINVLLVLAGRWACPWCTGRACMLPDWFWDRVPVWIVRRVLWYDHLLAIVCIPLHNRLHGGAR